MMFASVVETGMLFAAMDQILLISRYATFVISLGQD